MWGGHLSLLALASIVSMVSGQAQFLELSGACDYDNFLNGLVFEYKGRTQDGAPWYKALTQSSYYIYYDTSCDSTVVSPRWIIDNSQPSATRAKDLDNDGACLYHAYHESSSSAQPPSDVTWNMFCGGSWQAVVLNLREVQPGGTTTMTPSAASLLQIDGACEFKNWMNGMTFAMAGNTASGAPYYKSTTADYYIYYDPDCRGVTHGDPRWIIDNDKPSLYKTEDLDNDGDCVYQARVRVSADDWREPPRDILWMMDCGKGTQWEEHRLTMAVLTSTSTSTGTTVTQTVTTVTTTRTSSTVTSRTTTSRTTTTTPAPTTTVTTKITTSTKTSTTETTTATDTDTATSTFTEVESTTTPRATCENFACPADTILRSAVVPNGTATAAECCTPATTTTPFVVPTVDATTAAVTTTSIGDSTTGADTTAAPSTAATTTHDGRGHGHDSTTTPHSSGHGDGHGDGHQDGSSTLRLGGACDYMRRANGLNFERKGTTASHAPWYQAENYYIYYDPDCDGTGSNTAARWILDDNSPNAESANDLDSDGECKYKARIDSADTTRPPASGTWNVFCGSGWLPLTLTLQPEYIKITSGTCADVGRVPITSTGVCKTAATALGLESSVPVSIRSSSRPEGCYWDSSTTELQFTSSVANRGNGASGGFHPLCMFGEDDTQAAISLGRGFDLPILAVLLAVAVGLHHTDR